MLVKRLADGSVPVPHRQVEAASVSEGETEESLGNGPTLALTLGLHSLSRSSASPIKTLFALKVRHSLFHTSLDFVLQKSASGSQAMTTDPPTHVFAGKSNAYAGQNVKRRK